VALPFKDVVVLRHGDAQGNGMVVRLTTYRGAEIRAIAVPQDWPSSTGPTWTYLFDNEGLTLIDAGAAGSYHALADGIKQAGYDVGDVERVIVTHGHWDHDGAVAQLVGESGAELWAHDIYAHLLRHSPRDIERRPATPIQQEMRRVAMAHLGEGQSPSTSSGQAQGWASRRQQQIEARKGLEVMHGIRDAERFGGLTFIHAPGHSPDEICATLDGAVFTGDHVLPEITPHPTTKVRYPADVKDALPAEYRDEDRLYGLATYLRSLKRVADLSTSSRGTLGPDVAVLPAHRLFNHGRFNFEGAGRATEVIEHHAQRLGRILRRVGHQAVALEDVTRGIFEHRKLIGGNLYAALSEVVAHVELLEDAGDLEVTDDFRLHWKGTENYRQLISEL
jgi:glyoxylase-like metal-dependent hydrolase (beta-lactamase superfamily II)